VRHARRLRGARGIGFDAVAGFAVHLDGIDELGEAVPFQPLPERLDQRWTSADARAFLRDLRQFADGFFSGKKQLYQHAEQAMRATLDAHADLGWFSKFFGTRPGASFRLALGLLNGGCNYGPSVRLQDGSEELWCILGCWQTDEKGLPMFGKTVVATVVHEFCHSYCNPVIDRHLPALGKAGERLYAHVADAMRAQAYANARTLLCESLVRACVVRYVAATQDEKAVAAEVKDQDARSFTWVGALAARLSDYERQRDQFATLEAFHEELARFFAEAAPALEAAMQSKPKVVAMTPENGAGDVDPATTALVVTFDRPMRNQSWAVVGGGEHFPKLGKPGYDAERKVLTIPCELKPEWRYEFWLNRGQYQSFRSAGGEALAPVKVTFYTRAARQGAARAR
jgi:hypothetical protein